MGQIEQLTWAAHDDCRDYLVRYNWPSDLTKKGLAKFKQLETHYTGQTQLTRDDYFVFAGECSRKWLLGHYQLDRKDRLCPVR